jgi:protein phosphatase 2C family protein 2/3
MFYRTDNDFVEYGKRRGVSDGTTAVTVLIHSGKLYVANAGDSRAILIQRGGKVKSLSFDHKPSRYKLIHRL